MSPSERESRDKRMNDTTTRAKDDDKKNGHGTTTYYLYYLYYHRHRTRPITAWRAGDEFSIKMMK